MPQLESTAKAGYYPTPPRVIEALARILGKSWRDMHVLDPCCGAGDALANLVEALNKQSPTRGKITTYGIELNAERAGEANKKLHRVLHGDALNLYVQPKDAFGLVFLNPPYGPAGNGKRLEQEFLKLGTRFLAPEGIMIFIIPHYVARHISSYWMSWFHRTVCFKFPAPEFDDFRQVVFVGVKRWRKNYSQDQSQNELFTLVQNLDIANNPDHPDLYPEISPEFFNQFSPHVLNFKLSQYIPPTTGPEIFMLTDFGPEDFQKFASQSGLTEEVFLEHNVPDLCHSFRPIMSLRQGHLVQVLASGALNGKLRDSKGNEIWIKGRIYKNLHLVEDHLEDDGRTQVTVKRERFHYAVAYWQPDGSLREVSL